MRVINKKIRGREKRIHIFQFKDKKEFEIAVTQLKAMAEVFFYKEGADSHASRWTEIISHLEERVSDRFHDQDCALSSCLYEEEVDVLMECLVYMALAVNYYYDSVEQIRSSYDEIKSSFETIIGILSISK